MKSVLIAVLALLPLSSFAKSSCYQAVGNAPAGLPRVLCLEAIKDTSILNRLAVQSADKSFPAELNIDQTTYHNEDVIYFAASAILVDIWDTNCGERFLATLQVKGVKYTGEINPAALEIQAQTESTPDSCHSQAQFGDTKYQLVK